MPNARQRLQWRVNRFSNARDRQIRHRFRPAEYTQIIRDECQEALLLDDEPQMFYLARQLTASLPTDWSEGVSQQFVFIARNEHGEINARFMQWENAFAVIAGHGAVLVWMH